MSELLILHLSDLHFGVIREGKHEGESAHRFTEKSKGVKPYPDNEKPDPKVLANLLTKEFDARRPQIIAVSGDLGWSGIANDYKYALAFLRQLRQRWPKAMFVINGGNHDVNVATSITDNSTRQDAFVAFLKAFYGADFEKIFPLYDPASVDRRHLLAGIHYLPDKCLAVSVNTGASIQERKDLIVLSPSIFNQLEELLDSRKVPEDILRIFVLHHHLLPFAEPQWGPHVNENSAHDKPDNTIVANSAKVQKWLTKNSFHLALHGHKHIFHGREDSLWTDKAQRRIGIIGAASAGVSNNEIAPGQDNGCCVISALNTGGTRWQLDIQKSIFKDDAGFKTQYVGGTSRRIAVGEKPSDSPQSFRASDSRRLHAIIAQTTKGNGAFTNFISICESGKYVHPTTACNGVMPVTEREIQDSFGALHPEFEPSREWTDGKKIDQFFRRFFAHYRIVHGLRMFASFTPGGFRSERPTSANDHRPLHRALALIKSHPTRAYAGLYDPVLDLVGDSSPLPGLVGVQFVSNKTANRQLDLVMNFRNLELSFWWAVNMWEASKLLDWACNSAPDGGYKPGKITFFSALAEWKAEPEPMYIAKLDLMGLAEMTELVNTACAGGNIRVLVGKLKDKLANISHINIEYRGLEMLWGLIEGQCKAQKHSVAKPFHTAFRDELKACVEALTAAVENVSERPRALKEAKAKLAALIACLETFLVKNAIPESQASARRQRSGTTRQRGN